MARSEKLSPHLHQRSTGSLAAGTGQCLLVLNLLVFAAVAVASYILSPAALAQTKEDPRVWLDRMVKAAEALNYDGTFVYQSGGNTESMRIIHRRDADGVRERLLSLSGVAREVLRDNHKVTCILPDDASVMVGKTRGVNRGPLFSGVAIPDHYRLQMKGLDRVAGRVAERVSLEPRDEFRYGFRLWIDRQTGLLLRNEVVAPDDHTLESVAYTSLQLPDHIPDKLLEPGISGDGFRWLTWEERDTPHGEELATERNWQAGWVPDGFELREQATEPRPGGDQPVEHLVYSDGLASVSVFVERLNDGAAPLEGHSRMGAVSAYGRMLGEFQVTVVGEVPAATVERVGRAIEQVRP